MHRISKDLKSNKTTRNKNTNKTDLNSIKFKMQKIKNCRGVTKPKTQFAKKFINPKKP